MKQQHKIVLTVGSDLSGNIVEQLIDKLLNIGLADAAATIEDSSNSDEGDVEAASMVLSLDISTPGAWSMPTAVLEVDGGAIHCVRASEPMRIILLDQDTEGCDEDADVREINGDEVCILDYSLVTYPGNASDGVDTDFVMHTIEQIDDGAPPAVLSVANDEVPVGEEGRLVTLDGEEIIGTLERVPGTANIGSASRNSDGSINIEHGGETDIDWNEQKTVKINGERLFVTASGDTVTESQVKVVADD